VTARPQRTRRTRNPQPAAEPFVPHQPSEEDLLELRDPYGLELPERPDGWPIRPPDYVIVVAASDWYKEHFPAAGVGLWDVLQTGQDRPRHRDPEPDLEAEP
jgi:hypothetical protein